MARKKKSKKFDNNRESRDNNSRRGGTGKWQDEREPKETKKNVDDYLNGSAGSNDPSWWNRAGQISKDATSFTFQQATGSKMRGFELGHPYYTAAGVMVLDYVPTFGTVGGTADPINISSRLLYDAVNSKNSRTPSYDPSDLMVYVIALANAWSLHSWVRRVVGTYNTYDPNNRYWPKAIRAAMGVAPDASDQLIVRWREVANWIAVRLNMFNVPAGIPYFQREIFMNNAVYADMNSSKASYFLFNPRALFRYVDVDRTLPENVGGLVYEEFPSETPGGITPDVIWNYFETLVAPLFNDSIIPVMSADIEKAFGIGNCFRLPMITDAEVTIPVYNPEMLMQINNARIFPVDDWERFIGRYKITQDMTDNCLKATLDVETGGQSKDSALLSASAHMGIPINFPVDNPSNDAVIEATRLMWAVDPSSSSPKTVNTTSTEIIVDTAIFTYDYNVNLDVWELQTIPHAHQLLMARSNPVSQTHLEKVRKYSNFGWAPLLYVKTCASIAASAPIDYVYCWSDVYNYSTLSNEDLRVLNDSCMLSILGAV